MIFKVQPNGLRWILLATCFVILSSQETEARFFQLSKVPLADFLSKLDLRQSFELSKSSLLDWIRWVLKLSTTFLDPLYIGHMKIDVDDQFVTAQLTGDALTIRHLLLSTISNVIVEKDKLGVSANISFPIVKLQGVYNASGRVDELEMNISGRGLMAVTVTDLNVYGALRLKIGSKLTLKLEDLDYSLKDCNVLFDNLMGNDAVSTLLNGVVSDIVPVAAHDFKANVTQAIMDKVNQAIASYIPQI